MERNTSIELSRLTSDAADVQAVKAEEPKLAQEAKTELTGAGGAGTATPAATTAGAFMLFSLHVQDRLLLLAGQSRVVYPTHFRGTDVSLKKQQCICNGQIA